MRELLMPELSAIRSEHTLMQSLLSTRAHRVFHMADGTTYAGSIIALDEDGFFSVSSEPNVLLNRAQIVKVTHA